MTHHKPKEVKFVAAFLSIAIIISAAVVIRPYNIIMSEYYMSKFNKAEDISYAVIGYNYLYKSIMNNNIEVNNFISCSKALIESGEWDTLYYESDYGKNEDFSNKTPEVTLKVTYLHFVLAYQNNNYISEFLSCFDNYTDLEELGYMSASASLVNEEKDENKKQNYYELLKNGYVSLAESQDDRQSVKTYIDLSAFCELCNNNDDRDKYAYIADGKKQIVLNELKKDNVSSPS